MKNKRQELLGQMQRQYHRNHSWRLSQGGLFIPHCYKETKPDSLSGWDDVGFILNGKRVIVWWVHPRDVYSEKIDELSWQEAGPGPRDGWMFEGATTNFKKVGASRKKIVSYISRKPSVEQRLHYDHLDEIRKRMTAIGIDFEVKPSWKLERLTWAMGVSLVAPLEVRNEKEIADVAALARRLMLRQTSIETEFPGYRYDRADWIREQVHPVKQRATLSRVHPND